MYSKEEISKTKQLFWTSFGQYMKPVPSASGEKVNWPNYKTGVPHIFFRLQAEKGFASAAIELTHPDLDIRRQQFDQLIQFKNMLQGEWQWKKEANDVNGRAISSVHALLEGVFVMNNNDWPAIISFLKERMMALDVFWNEVKFAFE